MQSFIGNQFRKPTGFFGRVIAEIMTKGNIPEYDKVLPELNIQKNDHILEIGYGVGIGVDTILSDHDCFVSGIDFSEVMFKKATKRNKKHIENQKAVLHQGDFLDMDVVPNQYDKIFFLNVLCFWDKLEVPFSKIKTALKDNGLFCIFMARHEYLNAYKFTKDGIFCKYTLDQVMEALKVAGFGNISYNLYEHKGYIIKCIK